MTRSVPPRRRDRLVAGLVTLAAIASCAVATDPAPVSAAPERQGGGAAPGAVTTHGLTIPREHPRLWFDRERLQRAKAWYRKHGSVPRKDDVVGWAARGLLGGRESECRDVLAWAAAESGKMRRDGVSCDACRWSGEAIILAYDWCHAHLGPAERAAFVETTNAWVTHWRQQAWGGPQMPENNYFWGYLRNQLLWAIASYHENTAVAEALLEDVFTTRLAGAFDPAAASGPMRGGIGREGTQYGIYIASYATVPWTTSWLLGRDLFSESDYWREAAYHLVYSVSPAPTTGVGPGQADRMGYTFFPYSDDEQWLYGRQIGEAAANFMSAVAMRWPGAAVGRHARQWLALTGASASPFVKAVDPGGQGAAFGELPLDYYGPGAGMLYGRSAWGPSATTFHVHLKDGPDAGHAHAHWGGWQVWRKGRYLSRETVSYGENVAGYAGAGTAPAALHLAHNSLLVNGAGNRDAPWTSGRARVTRLESRPAYAFAATDLTATSNNPAFVRWEREFVFLRALETLVILDRIESSTPGATKTFLAHCEATPAATAAGATCTVGDQALVIQSLLPAAPRVRVVAEGGKVGQHRIELEGAPGAARSHVLTIVQARDRSAPSLSPSVKEDGGKLTVSLDGSTRVVFEAGPTSRGGSVTIGGATTALRADVQQVAVTEQGPVWR